MTRSVMFYEYVEGSDGEGVDVLVKMSEESARIRARKVHEFYLSDREFIPYRLMTMNDDDILESWMVVQWAWFNLEEN